MAGSKFGDELYTEYQVHKDPVWLRIPSHSLPLTSATHSTTSRTT